MHERALRTILLIQAIEESDRAGEVLPHADRAEATRVAARDVAQLSEAAASSVLQPVTVRFLARRAARLREHLQMRSPVIRRVLALAGGASWIGRVVLIIAFAIGVSMSALDGSRRINVLAFPLLGLVVWNLTVYALLIFSHLRWHGGKRVHAPALSALYDHWIRWRAGALLKRSSLFNAPLSAGLRRFAFEWASIARPLLLLRAKRLFHLGAALIALGLLAGLYVRGLALRYEAGWESTFLGAHQVHVLLHVLYGPASALSGIALPATAQQVDALRWTDSGIGQPAAGWIHLIAITAGLYIIVPRLAAALAAAVALWWRSRHTAAPAALVPYARIILMGAGGSVRNVASVVPYAYEPSRDSVSGLERLLPAALGGSVALDVRDPVRYGDEDAYAQRLEHRTVQAADWNLLLMNLAATPEAESHGMLIAGTRDWLMQTAPAAPLLAIVDEAPYAARLGPDPQLAVRLEERRKLWQEFVAGYGLKACILDLAQLPPDAELRVRSALWTAQSRAAAS